MMHRTPFNTDHVFEVSIYNKEVRTLVKENESHAYFDDHWATEQIRDVLADSMEHARDRILERFPADDGFVIASITPCREAGWR